MKIKDVLDFTRDISMNNNRAWFVENKLRYESVKACFEDFVGNLISRISEFDESVSFLTPKDCTYRIYRDLRFSEDKSPYKTHIGGYINSHGKKSFYSGYYIHIEAGASMIAGGSYCLPSPMLNNIRHEIYDNIDSFRKIVEDKSFRAFYPTIGGSRLKTYPKGFPKDFEFIDYIRCKDYTLMHSVSDSFFDDDSCVEVIVEAFRMMKPFNDFINEVIDDYYSMHED